MTAGNGLTSCMFVCAWLLNTLERLPDTATMNHRSEISRLWLNIIDIIGPIHLWPKDIRKLFWEKHWTNKQRFKIAVFAYINGLNPEVLLDWILSV